MDMIPCFTMLSALADRIISKHAKAKPKSL
jgi:hypothetical protein